MNLSLQASLEKLLVQSASYYDTAGEMFYHGLVLGLTAMMDDRYLVTNLTCTVDTKNRTYDIAFDCHGGHFADSGKLK